MIDFLRKYSIRVMAGLALLVSLGFYSLNLRHQEQTNAFERVLLTVTTPVGSVLYRVNSFFADIWDNYVFLVRVREENKQLKTVIKTLNTRVMQNHEAVLAGQRLQQLSALKQRLTTPSLAATIIGEDVTPWFRTVIIDRGALDGIREGMPVVAAPGVVGRVIRVASSSSRLLLLTDHASAIAGTVQRSRARGVVKGKSRGLCTLEFAERGEDVQVGDVIVTSGIGGVFPKGLPVGEVTTVKKGEYGIFQTVVLRPFVSTSRLEEVLVLLR
jgi:rod shape-determining protein MreC